MFARRGGFTHRSLALEDRTCMKRGSARSLHRESLEDRRQMAALNGPPTVVGPTPAARGYNLGRFSEGSNAADWWRHTGAASAQAFVSASDMEPTDDLPGAGDRGMPLGIRIVPASPAEVTLIESTLEQVAVPRSGPDRPRKDPRRLIYGKDADSDALMVRLKKRGIELICPHRCNRKRSSTQNG